MQKQGSIVTGAILILAGIFFLAAETFPSLADIINFGFLWPFIILAVGGVFLLFGLLNTPGLFIPGTIVSGVGMILLYQNSTGNWHHWQLWLLVPALVGVGLALMNIREGRGLAGAMPATGILLAVGLGLFVVFSFADLWPVVLIVIGAAMLVSNVRTRQQYK